MRTERELSTNLDEKVILYVEQPEQGRSVNEFSCKIGLEGNEIDKTAVIYGIDPMQALLLSIRHLSGFVERSSESIHPRRLIWDLGENEHDFGLLV
jgi:hypothetical protein